MKPDEMEPDVIEPDAMETEVKRARATPEECSACRAGCKFTLLIIIVGGILGLWLIGPFRAAKVETSTDTAESSEAPGYQLTPQQWATMRTAKLRRWSFCRSARLKGRLRSTSISPQLSTSL